MDVVKASVLRTERTCVAGVRRTRNTESQARGVSGFVHHVDSVNSARRRGQFDCRRKSTIEI